VSWRDLVPAERTDARPTQGPARECRRGWLRERRGSAGSDQEHERLEQLGLTLAEGKQLLREVQRRVVQQQATAFLATQTACPTCGRERSLKDHKTLGLRTLFGKLSLHSPRVRQCCRQSDGPASISPLTTLVSERSAPELQYLETRWASLV